jgi:hypothetical protein
LSGTAIPPAREAAKKAFTNPMEFFDNMPNLSPLPNPRQIRRPAILSISRASSV